MSDWRQNKDRQRERERELGEKKRDGCKRREKWYRRGRGRDNAGKNSKHANEGGEEKMKAKGA